MVKKKSKYPWKKIVRQAHLYLGIISGSVIFIVALTGCLWTFQEEIEEYSLDIPEIERQDLAVITPMEAQRLAHSVFPGRQIHGTLYEGENEPVKVIFYELAPEFYHTVYLHPYSGETLKVEDNLTGFFPFVLEGHRYLWLPKEIGSQVVSWCTVIFAVMLITGIVLWLPKKNYRQRLKFDWKKTTNWKRRNYDLHSVLGFYLSFIAVIIIYTGLIMAFEPFKEVVYKGMGGKKDVPWTLPQNISETSTVSTEIPSVDRLFYDLQNQYPNALNLEFHYPVVDSDAIYVEIGYQDGVYYSADYRFYDQNTLEEISSPTIYGIYDEAGIPEKVMRMNYDVHVGAIGGLPGKLIAFFASLLCASLPVTGFVMWYGRKFKKKPKPVKIPPRRKVILLR